jgi:hypothetical protein
MIAHMTAKPTELNSQKGRSRPLYSRGSPYYSKGIADITGEVPHFFSIHRGGCVALQFYGQPSAHCSVTATFIVQW